MRQRGLSIGVTSIQETTEPVSWLEIKGDRREGYTTSRTTTTEKSRLGPIAIQVQLSSKLQAAIREALGAANPNEG